MLHMWWMERKLKSLICHRRCFSTIIDVALQYLSKNSLLLWIQREINRYRCCCYPRGRSFSFPASKMQLMQLLFCDSCWLCFTTLNPSLPFSCFFFFLLFCFCFFGGGGFSAGSRGVSGQSARALLHVDRHAGFRCQHRKLRAASYLVGTFHAKRRLWRERYGAVGVDPLARVDVWKWHHFMSSVHESGIASPVNGMNYVWQEKVKAVFCIICRLLSKLTFGQPFAGFREGWGRI